MNKQLLVAAMRRRIKHLDKEAALREKCDNLISMVSFISKKEELSYWLNKIEKAPRGKYGR